MAAAKVGTGAVIGALSKNAPSNLHGIGMGSVNASAKFAHGARKALSANHKNVGGAIAAGTAAVLGHGAVATAAAAAAPVIVATAVVGGAAVGAYKLFQFVKERW